MYFDAGTTAVPPAFALPQRPLRKAPHAPLRLVETVDHTPVVEHHLTEAQLAAIEQRLRMALTARYGPDLREELVADCLAWAWENQQKLAEMDNPVGYLLRVAQSRSRRHLRWRKERANYPAHTPTEGTVHVEPGLPRALASLDEQTRTTVVLVHCFEWTYTEVADLLEVPIHTVRNRLHRGLRKLRHELGVHDV